MAASDYYQGYQCKFIDPIPEHFYCKKCTLVARRLIFTSCCTESYCHVCIADTQQQAKPCPACGEKTFTTIKPLKYQRQMESLQVYCSMRGRGCGWSGTLKLLDAHLDPDQDNCQHLDTKCPLNCQQAIPKNKVEQHVAKECVKRDHICQYCAFKATYEEVVDTHLPECIYFPLQCPNFCGVTCERDFMEDHIRMCHLEEVACEFSDVGCDGKFIRDDLEEHTRKNSLKHLSLMAVASVQMKKQLQQKLQEQELRLQEQEQMYLEVNKKLHEQGLKHQADEQKLEQKIQDQEQKLREQEQKFQEQEKMVKKLLEEQEKTAKQLQDNSRKNEITVTEIKQMMGLKRTFTMKNFSKEKAKDKPDDWKSLAMYTHACGHKFCIGIDANGRFSARGKAIVVDLMIMQGEFDHQLKWPAEASFTIELLNPEGGENIKCATGRKVLIKPGKPYKCICCFGCNALGIPYGFLEHTKLEDFLHNDTLYFKLTDVTVY